MLISIIIPIYNAEKYLVNCIESILNQTYRNFELILVDDGSFDKSYEICNSYAFKDNRIKVIHQINQGQGVARNAGLNIANGIYISFVDADDLLLNDGLEKLNYVLRNEAYDIVSGTYYSIRDSKKKQVTINNSGVVDRYGSKKETIRYHKFKTTSCFGYVWGKLYKKSYLDYYSIRFNEQKSVFMEDTLFNLKLMCFKPKYYLLNEPVYTYFVYPASTSNSVEEIKNKSIAMLENYLEFLKEQKTLDDNMDLFLPLYIRIILWTVFKSVEKNGLSYKNILIILKDFDTHHSFKSIIHKKDNYKSLKHISQIEVRVFSYVCLFLFKHHMRFLVGLPFMIIYPLVRVYVKKRLKS